jgi:hypothetical protein
MARHLGFLFRCTSNPKTIPPSFSTLAYNVPVQFLKNLIVSRQGKIGSMSPTLGRQKRGNLTHPSCCWVERSALIMSSLLGKQYESKALSNGIRA